MDNVFVDVENRGFETVEGDGMGYTNTGSMAVGNGSQVFRVDQSGMWMGAEAFADAPFSVDMAGNLVASSADLGGTGYSKTVTFAQDAIPTSVSIGDLWVDTNDDNKLYRAAAVGATTIAAGQWEAVPDGYKLDKVGGTYVTTLTAAAAKVQLLPDANTGIVAYASDGSTVVFKVEVGGATVGDVTLGDYAGGSGVLWDQSGSTMYIKGDMTAGSIDGVTITGGTITGSTISTAASGERISMQASSAELKLYDSNGDEVFQLDDDGNDIDLEAKDGRDLVLKSAGNVAIADGGGIRYDAAVSSAQGYDWGMARYKNGGAYGYACRMEGGDWNIAMNAGVPT